MTFIDELQKTTNYTLTQNGAKTNKSTLNSVLDYFALAGAMRSDPGKSATLFEKAFIEDPQLAVRCLFYLRDVRGGQGERDVFYAGLSKLKELSPSIYSSILNHIPEYGRWDDLFANGVTDDVVNIISDQLVKDEAEMRFGRSVSLMAKWLPSENTSSKQTQRLAKELAERLGLSPRDYRKRVVALRKYIVLLEQKMSSNKWSEIDYSKIPSQAFRGHTKAFERHDGERFAEFLTKAESGEVKLNTSTLYTYEVYLAMKAGQKQAANAMWVNLPDYTDGRNALVVADVSGSMSWTQGTPKPIDISVSLAMYFADRNTGPFKGYFMTFSNRSQLVKVEGKTLEDRFRFIERAEWGGGTNLQSSFDAILDAAISAEATQEEMPSTLYIISDMEFNSCVDLRGSKKTNLKLAEEKFHNAGYQLPHVVFWNVDAKTTQVPATKFDNKVTLISGFSQSNFRYAVEGKTAVEFMTEVLNSERYATIVV